MALKGWKAASVAFFIAASMAGSASASELVHQFNNPSFGGNPFNSSHLLGIANAVNKNTGPSTTRTTQSDAELFTRQLQSRLLSSLAAQVSEAIFGENPQESGVVEFGDQRIEFSRGLEAVTLKIIDIATGTETIISVPVLQGSN